MKKPHFPVIMFLAALFKDLILDLVVFISSIILLPLGWIMGVMFGFIYAGIFALWFMFKDVSIQRKLAARFIVGLVIAWIIGFIPLLRFLIPEMALFVFFIYYLEKKEWKTHRKRARKTLAETPPPIRAVA